MKMGHLLNVGKNPDKNKQGLKQKEMWNGECFPIVPNHLSIKGNKFGAHPLGCHMQRLCCTHWWGRREGPILKYKASLELRETRHGRSSHSVGYHLTGLRWKAKSLKEIRCLIPGFSNEAKGQNQVKNEGKGPEVGLVKKVNYSFKNCD